MVRRPGAVLDRVRAELADSWGPLALRAWAALLATVAILCIWSAPPAQWPTDPVVAYQLQLMALGLWVGGMARVLRVMIHYDSLATWRDERLVESEQEGST